MKKPLFSNTTAMLACLGVATSLAFAAESPRKKFGKGNPFRTEELPAGKLKTKLQSLNPQAKDKATKWLHTFDFDASDAAEHLRVDDGGGIFIVCPDGHDNHEDHSHAPANSEAIVEIPGASGSITPEPAQITGDPPIANAAVSVSSPPAYHSRPGASRRIYLDFNGGIVAGTAWNSSEGVASWDVKVWSQDTDRTTFNDAEQAWMKKVWQRISEDYAPFDVDVTTDVAYDPDIYTGNKDRVGWLMICEQTDNNNVALPHSGSGGVAYVGVFGNSSYSPNYQPAWVSSTNGGGSESIISEAASHEMGHNMGLSHDTTNANPNGYYGGHGSGNISWGPIMGTGYNRNVSQWSKGEYYDANLLQDDLSTISGRVAYRTDDHGNTVGTATALTVTSGTTITSTTPENDPSNSSADNKGVIQTGTDIDVFSFQTGAGNVVLNVNPWKQPSGTFGGNLDVSLELRDAIGTVIALNNPDTATTASISATLSAGTYYLFVTNSGAGTPLVSPPSGYTSYGSVGQYFVSGTIVDSTPNLLITPAGDLASSGIASGPFTPSSLQYTIQNTGTTSLNWTASKGAAWVTLSSTGGSLSAGSSTLVTVTINSAANSLAIGNYNDTVNFTNTTSGNGNTTRNVTLAVTAIPATVTLGNLNPTYDGNPKPVTVTTNPPSLAHSVTYTPAGVPVNVGTYPVTANITDPNYSGSASGSLVIAKASQSITFGALASVTDAEPPFSLGATASSSLPVSYASSNTSVATVSGNTVTIVGAGNTTITASQAGSSNYNAATNVPQTLTVTRLNPLSAPGGPYKVLINQSLSVNGSTSLPSGVETITAYDWDLNNDGNFGDVTGATPAAVSYADLTNTWGMVQGANTIQLRVTDSAAKTSTSSATVNLLLALTWDANNTGANQTNGAGAWLGANQWWDGSANLTWVSGSDAVFGGPSTAGGTVTLASPTSLGELTFNTFTGTYTLGTAGQSLTVSGNMKNNSASGAVTISSPIIMGAAQTWTNNSSGLLKASGGLDNVGNLQTFNGSGSFDFSGTANLITGAGGITMNGSGRLILGGGGTIPVHDYSGTTTINNGTVMISSGNLGSGNLTLNGGVIETYWATNFTRPLGAGVGEMQITGGASGFSLNGSTGASVIINNSTTYEVVWGSAYFNPSMLVLQAASAQNSSALTFQNKIDLNGATRTIHSSITTGTGAGSATISGVIRDATGGSAGLIKEGSGKLILTGVNTYTGDTTINGGKLQIGNNTASSLGSGNYAANILMSAGSTLSIWSTSNQILSGDISGNGNVEKAYGNTLTLSGHNTYTGKTSISPQTTAGSTLSVSSFNSVNGGTPLLAYSSLGAPTTVANGTVTIGNSGKQASCTLLYTGSGEITDRVIDLQFNGSAKQTINAGGSGLLKFTSPFTVVPSSGSTAGGVSLRGTGNGEIAGGIATAPGLLEKLDSGTWTISGATNFAGATTITAGTLALGANNVLSNASAVSIGSGTLDAATYTDTLGTLDVTAATSTINLGAGAALAFADSSAIDWTGGTLNLTGNFVPGLSLRFGTSNSGLTSTQLNKISAAGFGSLALDANGYLTNDATPPTLTSITDNKSGGPVTVNTVVTYTIAFSEDMDSSTLTPASFGNVGTSAATIGSVTETTPTSGVFTLLVTPTSSGSLRLQINAASVVKDAAGNNLDTASAILDDTTLAVDGTPPTLTSITDDKSGGPIPVNTLVTYTVTFNEDMDAGTVTPASFGNSGTATITLGAINEITPGVFTVEATPTTEGTLQLQIHASSVLKDVAGNNLDTASAILDDTTLTVDGTPPTLTSISDDKSGSQITVNTLVTYTVTFSEDMDAVTVTPASFGNAGTATITLGAINEITPGVFTVEATPTAEGTLRLQIHAAAVLKDVAGISLNTTSAILDDTTLTVDGTPPTLTSISDDKSGGPIPVNTLVTYTVTFSEDMDAGTVTPASFGNAGTATVTLGAINEITPGVFTVEATPTTEGTLQLQIHAAAVLKDVAGNNLNTTSAILDDTTLTVDGTPPTLTSISDDKSGGPIPVNTLVTYTVTFSEDMDAGTVTPASFGNAGTATITLGAINEITPGAFTVEATPTTEGTLQLQIHASAVLKDAAGNNLNTASAILDDTTLTVDGTPPTLTSISDDKSGGPIPVNTLVSYTVTFSEDMDAVTVTPASFGNAGTATITLGAINEITPGVFTVEATPTTEGTLQLQIHAATVLKDVAGNNLDTVTAILDDTTLAVQSPYNSWSASAAFDADANNDGVDNGTAWVLGAADPSSSATGLLPTLDNTDPEYIIFTYRRSDAANTDANTAIQVQYSSTLGIWVNAVHDGDNIIIQPTDNFYGSSPGVDKVEVRIKRNLVIGGKFFARLNVVTAP